MSKSDNKRIIESIESYMIFYSTTSRSGCCWCCSWWTI